MRQRSEALRRRAAATAHQPAETQQEADFTAEGAPPPPGKVGIDQGRTPAAEPPAPAGTGAATKASTQSTSGKR